MAGQGCGPMTDATLRQVKRGGLSPGAPRGSKNGNFKDGHWTAEAIEERKWLRPLIQAFG
jgi:hypothetical protein